MKRRLSAVLLIALTSAPAAAQTADSLARAVVQAVNLPDAEQRRFVQASFSPRALERNSAEELAALLKQLREQSGGVRLVGFEPAQGSALAILSSLKQPRYALLAVSPDREQPTRIGRVQVLKSWHPATDSIAWPNTRLSEAELKTVIERNVRRLGELDAFSGVVLVGKQDRVLVAAAHGYSNRDHMVRNQLDTKFNFASMGKMFTAIAIGQLVQAGRLSLDDTLAQVLPAYPQRENARRITIRQLLSHKAGLGSMFEDARFDRRRDYESALALVSAVADKPLAFEPGTRWSYSNEGYEVLAAVIEKVSGLRYADYVRKHIFEPAGMTSTDNFRLDRIVPNRATGYAAREDDYFGVEGRVPNSNIVGLTGTGAGGGYTTAPDLWKFAQALRRNTLLSAAMRDTLMQGREPLPWDANTRYGYGFMHARVGEKELYGHNGGGTRSGIDTDFAFFTDGSYTVIVLSNYDPPSGHDLQRQLKRLLSVQ
ncbi:MAG TPA: serine hydrolase domain-containing protein [Longimicrobiales bacterium]|nr:serine hydrolase domain-containing protein [Longimicrobiales bacterium]